MSQWRIRRRMAGKVRSIRMVPRSHTGAIQFASLGELMEAARRYFPGTPVEDVRMVAALTKGSSSINETSVDVRLGAPRG